LIVIYNYGFGPRIAIFGSGMNIIAGDQSGFKNQPATSRTKRRLVKQVLPGTGAAEGFLKH
jgi:hypothetical protein